MALDWLLLGKALIQGIIEGLTEFLPISSTGHLIISGSLLNFNNDKAKVFDIAIQSGAILAVCYEYRQRIYQVLSSALKNSSSQKFILNILIAFLPAAFIGLLLGSTIKLYLFNPLTVACAFIVGGILILWVEARPHTTHINEIDDISFKTAAKVGLIQCLALIPGTSRSGATIIGSLWLGFSRKAATEFSFFLAIPVIFAATSYDLFKHQSLLNTADVPVFLTGFFAAFISALLTIRALLRFVANHSFAVFAWYRIAVGALILLTYHSGWINW